MAVYVDDMYKYPIGNYRGMKMSHLIADTTKELLQTAKAIGVNTKWIQHLGTANEHFDICLSKRNDAIKLGVIPITYRGYARRVQKKALAHGIPWTHTSVTIIKAQ